MYINNQRDDSNQLKNKKVEVAFHRSDVVYKVSHVHFELFLVYTNKFKSESNIYLYTIKE